MTSLERMPNDLTGGWTPKASANGLACTADDFFWLEAGAKADAETARVERTIAVFMMVSCLVGLNDAPRKDSNVALTSSRTSWPSSSSHERIATTYTNSARSCSIVLQHGIL